MVVIDSGAQVKQWDEATRRRQHIGSDALMERAATAFTARFAQAYPLAVAPEVHVFCGPGNNGGDGAAVARLLEGRGYQTFVYATWEDLASVSADLRLNWQRLLDTRHPRLRQAFVSDEGLAGVRASLSAVCAGAIAIDALFGVGLDRPLAGAFADLVGLIGECFTEVVSVDTPSGVDAGAKVDGPRVHATRTFTFGAPKLAALLPHSGRAWGAWEVLDIGLEPNAAAGLEGCGVIIAPSRYRAALAERSPFSHKGTVGHVLVLAGSEGKAGAALMSGTAAYRAGCGLVTFAAPRRLELILQIGLPEAMILPDPHETIVTRVPDLAPYDAIVVGPGLGTSDTTAKMLAALFADIGDTPLVIDADALNLIAADDTLREAVPHAAILTPHPGEFRRLAGDWETDRDRLAALEAFAKTCTATVVLKDRYTAVAHPDRATAFNLTGNPGMATGGMGDTLTGVIAALLARGIDPADAAELGVLLHGTAGDIAARELGYEALLATDVIAALGAAFGALRKEIKP